MYDSRLIGLKRKAKRQGWAHWIRAEHDERAVLDGHYFSQGAADHVCGFFHNFLHHYEGDKAGQPFILDDWQRDRWISPLFGWMKADGRRRYRQSYNSVPKKQGKSTISSGLGLYMGCGDGEPGAKVIFAAVDSIQARICFDAAAAMVQKSDDLAEELEVIEHVSRIVHAASGSVIRTLSKESRAAEGLNAHCVIVDELHVWPGTKMWKMIRHATAGRPNGMIIIITTSGDDLTSVCYKRYLYAKKILEGVVYDPTFFALIYEAPEDVGERPPGEPGSWTDPEVHRACNPGYGITVQPDEMTAACLEAQVAPEEKLLFLQKRLNIWVQPKTAYFKMSKWDACEWTFRPEDLHGRVAYGGLDLASVIDLCAYVLVFPPVPPEEWWPWLCWFWVPEAAIENTDAEDRDGLSYRQWVDEGLIIATEGEVTDYDFIEAEIKSQHKVYDIKEDAYDRHNATQIVTHMSNEGFTMIPYAQTCAFMNMPVREIGRQVTAGLMGHNQNKVLRYMAHGAMVKKDSGGNIKFCKSSSKSKIDGLVAGAQALGRAMLRDDADHGTGVDFG